MHTLQTKNSSSDVMYFVYPADTIHCAKSVTRQLSLSELHCFPRDFFFSSVTYQAYYRKVFLINRGEKLSYGVILEDYHNCCGQPIKEYFFANVSLLGEEFLEFDSIILRDNARCTILFCGLFGNGEYFNCKNKLLPASECRGRLVV